ncbi:putative exoribonuclease II [Rosa chinensis]|uniref:Putative exoribonuclease II n=1 Tax=Rosa chinensis TaxID=74649 RepID=A0A2P6RNP5_ROSCH|nr:small RNA degrading nuclease 3 isoform X1 [Rosa chinensis]PRQ48058.1 putative exoribonuclease II [Rosa chinensis]
MDDFIATAEKKVLVEIVKLAQKRGMKGSKGDWKQFLASYDKKFGASLSDPGKRSIDVLTAFVRSFDKQDDLKLFAKVVQCNSNRQGVDQFLKNSPANESKEQKLVRVTLEHPQYPIDYSFPSHNQDWVITKLNKKSKQMSNAMLAVDCEMVLCKDGSEALVRVCVVDQNLEVKLDELVNPNKKVADYRTVITGMSAADLAGVTCTLADIQKSFKKLLSDGTILVGHSLNNDLQALKIDHIMVIDTAYVFRYSDGPISRKPSLNNLCKSVLGYEVRKKGSPHNCLDDACAAMKLVLAKVEREVGDTIPSVQEDVPDTNMAKLLLHRIPRTVPSVELQNAIPGNFTLEVKKPSVKAKGGIYSAFAIFKNQQEAHQAYEIVQGSQEEDSSGRPQKLTEFKLSTGVVTNLYVRKMVDNGSSDQTSSKRSLEVEESTGANKKQKIGAKIEDETMADLDHCCDHLKEIERLKQEQEKLLKQCSDQLKDIEGLKQEIKNREYEISMLKKSQVPEGQEKRLYKKKDKKKRK